MLQVYVELHESMTAPSRAVHQTQQCAGSKISPGLGLGSGLGSSTTCGAASSLVFFTGSGLGLGLLHWHFMLPAPMSISIQAGRSSISFFALSEASASNVSASNALIT